MVHAVQKYSVSERCACQALGINRSIIRYINKKPDDEEALKADITRLAEKYGRYGYRRITELLKAEGWRINHKRVERIWRSEGLRVPKKQRKRGRLYLNDGSIVRKKAVFENHVWSYDFVEDKLHNGKTIKMLTIIDEYTRKCLKIHVGYRLKTNDVIKVLSELFIEYGKPSIIRSDNGKEFTSKNIRNFLKILKVENAYIYPGSPWENGFVERFNGILRDELLNGEMFYTIEEAAVITEDYRQTYNNIRPHSSLGYMSPCNKFTSLNLDQHLGA